MMKSLVVITVLSLSLPFLVKGQAGVFEPVDASIEVVHQISCDTDKGVAAIHIEGNAAPYTLEWQSLQTGPANVLGSLPAGSHVLDNLESGPYDIRITDGFGNYTDKTFFINKPLTIEIIFIRDATCNGLSNGAATVKVTGGAGGYSYRWMHEPYHTSASVSGLSSGMYVVFVKDQNGCEVAEAVTIINKEVIEVDIEIDNFASADQANASLSAITGDDSQFYVYEWNTLQGHHTAQITGVPAGAYAVIVSDSRGCSSTASIQLDAVSAINRLDIQYISETIRIYANSNTARVVVEAPSLEIPVQMGLLDNAGRLIKVQDLNPHEKAEFDMSQMPVGIYNLFMIAEGNRYPLGRRVVRH